jgi:outer membrane lipoprotein SlyB
MTNSRSIAVLVLTACAALGGCGSMSGSTPTSYQASVPDSATGTLDSIQTTRVDSGTNGTGAVVGGVLGALVGNQVGSGSGRTAATVAGAAGGALVGNQVEKNRNVPTHDAYQLNVRLDDGRIVTVVQDTIADLRVGNRVRLMNGHVERY